MKPFLFATLLVSLSLIDSLGGLSAAEVLKLWPDTPPGETLAEGEEVDRTKPTDRQIAGRRLIRLGNVASPEAHVYLPAEEKRNGSAVVICPGGGFNILAWDLEGTEVAEWFNEIGVAAVVVKYRVPSRGGEQEPWVAPVQDCQRAISLTRHWAKKWKLDPERIGVLGFSAGGKTAAVTTVTTKRQYEAIDEIDQQSATPNFAMLIYAAYLLGKDGTALSEEFEVTEKTPPMFIVHAFDDGVPVAGALQMMLALKKAKVGSEIHVYDTGGHGYGLRPVESKPVTSWPKQGETWLKRNEWIK